MASDPIKELQKIEGINEDLATKLVEEEIDSADSILVAGVEGLGRIEGFDQVLIQSVLEQAAIMTGKMQKAKQSSSAQVEEKVCEFKKDLRDFINMTRQRYAAKMDKDKVQAFIRESKRIETALALIEENISGYLNEIHKSLEEAEEKISELSGSKIRETTRKLKQTRKQLTKVIE